MYLNVEKNILNKYINAGINCGSHFAATCAVCTINGDKNSCMGECVWEEETSICVDKGISTKKIEKSPLGVGKKNICQIFKISYPNLKNTSLISTG